MKKLYFLELSLHEFLEDIAFISVWNRIEVPTRFSLLWKKVKKEILYLGLFGNRSTMIYPEHMQLYYLSGM